MTCPQCQAANEAGEYSAVTAAVRSAGPLPRICPLRQQLRRPPGPGNPTPAPGMTSPFPHRGQPMGGTPAGAAPFRLDVKRLSAPERLVGGATVVALISLFLPWFGFSALGSSFSISGVTAHGYLYISLIVSLAILAYLVLRAGWDALPVTLPIAPGPLLLIGTGLQFLIIVIAFLVKPVSELSWDIGAYLALIAAIAAAAPVAVPAIRSMQNR